MNKTLGRNLSKREWRKLADWLMLAKHDPGVIGVEDLKKFQDARDLAVFYMGNAPEGKKKKCQA